MKRRGRRPTGQRRKAWTTGSSEAGPGDSPAVQSRPHRQQNAGRKRTGRSRWSHLGTKETDSGKQDASACCASGEAWQTQKYYPVAQVHLQWRGENEMLKVGVLPHLEEDIIIGTDYADFPTLLTKAGQEHTLKSWWEDVPFEAGVGLSRDPKVPLTGREKRVQRKQYWKASETNPEMV
ncbi:hypothetical protein NDU88_004184 [Pleurodeles waltl]|uniref:Uncharacterized protein n=1 Tax=Pleurodeles waltl TaxID=8319 RepID=A0AAV7MSR5_PLEWA|nr:hypothetical protein NDU88_004184 [Pleurodeles waltl]